MTAERAAPTLLWRQGANTLTHSRPMFRVTMQNKRMKKRNKSGRRNDELKRTAFQDHFKTGRYSWQIFTAFYPFPPLFLFILYFKKSVGFLSFSVMIPASKCTCIFTRLRPTRLSAADTVFACITVTREGQGRFLPEKALLPRRMVWNIMN